MWFLIEKHFVAVMAFSERPADVTNLSVPAFCLCFDGCSLLLGFHGNPGTCSLRVWHSIRIRDLQSEDTRWMAGMRTIFFKFFIKIHLHSVLDDL